MEPLKPSKYVIVERIVTGATALIWIGVLLMAVGLTMAYLQVRTERQAVAQAKSLSFVAVAIATPMASPTATAPPTSTNTPTPTINTPTPDFVATFVWLMDPDMLPAVTTRTPTSVVSPSASLRTGPIEPPTPASTSTVTPVPSPTPGDALAASGPPDRIVIPSINVDTPIVPIGWHIEEQGGQKVSVWDVPDNAVGWHKTSAYPGSTGNIVLNGHHNIRGEVFRYLIDLEPQARILLYVDDEVYYYSLTEKHLLKEKGEPAKVRYQNAQWIAPTKDERLTMVTCWPYTSNSHRLVIVAKPYRTDLPQAQ